ncbi:MAG: hypothetical protein KatS3mg131_1301 [Candidatus Tectimicrobiota bacterium]|nr:MAG: hypothetical protein KatS3mg131_1301 [Candidatus Tectomicrobia bacterium]
MPEVSLSAVVPALVGFSLPAQVSAVAARGERGESAQPLRQLEPSQLRLLRELQRRDRAVRAHEQAHLLAAGPLAQGGARFVYRVGPDGKRYAVEGEVPIDTRPVPGNPQATKQKAARIRRAALAPLHPSAADLAIAMKATAMMAQAQLELIRQQGQETPDRGLASPLPSAARGIEAYRHPPAVAASVSRRV